MYFIKAFLIWNLFGTLLSEEPCKSIAFKSKETFAGTGVILEDNSNSLHLGKVFLLNERSAKAADSLLVATIHKQDAHQKTNYYKLFDRQYIGFVDSVGRELIFINLIKRRNAKMFLGSKEYDKELKCNIILAFVEPGKEFLERYLIDTKKKAIQVY